MAEHLQFNLPDHEKLISCPYNKAHMVVAHRMPKHLMKCRRSHSTIGFQECRFNSSHILPEAKIQEHEATCPERLNIELYMLKKLNEKPKESAPSSFVIEDFDEENWDNNPPVPTYDAYKKCLESNVWIHVQHGTPSGRKAAREMHRQRVEKFNKISPSADK